MADRIMTTHVGACRAREKIIELNHKRADGEKVDEAAFDRELKTAVVDTVKSRKRSASISSTTASSATTWAGTTTTARGGPTWCAASTASRSRRSRCGCRHWRRRQSTLTPKDFTVGEWLDRRDWKKFEEAYMDPRSGCALPEQFMTHYSPVVTGTIKYKGQDAIKRDIANLKAGLEAAGIKEGGWMNSVAPASCSRMANEHYKNEEELMLACADAMREEYKAIVDAGLILQLDDPAIGENWDQQKNEPSVEGYRK